MYKVLSLVCVVLLVSACGGGGEDPSSSTSSSSTANSSPSSTSSSAASSSSGSNSTAGNAAAGAQSWDSQCRSCHGDFDSGRSNGAVSKIDAAAVVNIHDVNNSKGYASLADYIADKMPPANPGSCAGQCAADTAAFIRSQAVYDDAFSCADESHIKYSKRSLVLLTSDQYQAALEDLLGVTSNYGASLANNDGEVAGFYNMDASAVQDSVADTYLTNAEQIAAWAVQNNKPFACSDANTCASKFVDEFAYKAFRRPLTSAERNSFISMFSNSAQAGLELALATVLSSPQFLYIDLTGVGISQAQQAGYYTNTSGSGSAASGGEAVTVAAVDFSTLGNNMDVQNGYVRLWGPSYGWGLQHTFDRPFADPTMVSVVAYGTPKNGSEWPEMLVKVDQTEVGRVVLGGTDTTYSFVVEGMTGNQTIRIEFENEDHLPEGETNGRDIFVKSVTVSDVVESVEVEEDNNYVNPLDSADSNAYVLTPHQFASALSFMFTGSTPDETLLAAAANDQLTTDPQIQAHVERLIDSPRGRTHFGDFVGKWFSTDDVATVTRNLFPQLTSSVKQAMAQEVREQFKHVFYNEDVPFSEFYSADYTFLNNTLASYYGVAGNFGNDFVQTQVAGRGGPISSGAWMTVFAHAERTSPIRRAVHARADAMCHHIDPPDSPLAAPDIDEQRAAAQARVEAYEAANGLMSSKDFYFTYTDGLSACAGCHEYIINPMFGLEDFDNVGLLRPGAGGGSVIETLENQQITVSLEGTLYGIESTDDPEQLQFSGSKDFSNKIAQTEAVKSCLVRKGFRFATGLPTSVLDLDDNETLTDEQKEDFSCAASQMFGALMSNGESPRAMFSKLGTLDLVRFRK